MVQVVQRRSIIALLFTCLLWVAAPQHGHTEGPSFDQLMGLAQNYKARGFRQQAISILREAEQLESVTDEDKIDLALSLAQLYFEVGEYPISQNQLDYILVTSNPTNTVEISARNIQAAILSILNQPKAASLEYQRAAKLADKQPTLKLISQTNHMRHELDHNNWREAKSLSEQLLSQTKSENRSASDIELQISLGELLLKLAHSSKDPDFLVSADRVLKQAELSAESAGLTRLASFAMGYRGQGLLDAGKVTQALPVLNRAAFLASSVNAYDSAYLWQWQTARGLALNGDSQSAIENYQTAITTLEYVRKDLITGSPFTFPQKIQPLFSELSDLLLQQARGSRDFDQQQGYLQQVQTVLEQSKSAELQDYFQNDCVIPDQTIDLNQIADATAVIYPIVLPDRLEILVNIGTVIQQFESEISATELTRLVNDFRDNLQRDQGDDEYKEIGEELFDAVLAKAEPALQKAGVDTLLVIPDGSLRTIPFSALFDGEEFLIEKYAIATTPGISLTLPKPLDVEQATLFAGGVSDAVQGFSGLPGVPVELQRLEANYGAAVLQDQDFNRSAIQGQLSSPDYSIVHIATHGHFDSNPQESFLLAYDDKFTMDLLEESIGQRGDPLELLVLSACETAVGDNRAALGLAGVALKAGARSAVATLWQISDAATVEVIQTFYAESDQPTTTKAKALRAAQLQLINSQRFFHPSDWAPFLLIGNWL